MIKGFLTNQSQRAVLDNKESYSTNVLAIWCPSFIDGFLPGLPPEHKEFLLKDAHLAQNKSCQESPKALSLDPLCNFYSILMTSTPTLLPPSVSLQMIVFYIE